MKKYILQFIFIICLTFAGQSQWFWYNPVTDGSYLYDICFTSADNGWAVGTNGKILHYNGQHWEAIPSGTDRMLCGVCFIDLTMDGQ